MSFSFNFSLLHRWYKPQNEERA